MSKKSLKIETKIVFHRLKENIKICQYKMIPESFVSNELLANNELFHEKCDRIFCNFHEKTNS